MKRALILAMALAFASAARPSSTSTPIPRPARPCTRTSLRPDADTKSVNVNADSGPATKSAVEQDKALDKGRKKVADDAKKAGETRTAPPPRRGHCNAAKQNFQIYSDGGRI